MTKAVRYHKQGGPEVLQLDDVQVGDPGAGQVRIRHTAIGVNFVDTYQRSGLYPMQLPQVAGNEAAGVVAETGSGVASGFDPRMNDHEYEFTIIDNQTHEVVAIMATPRVDSIDANKVVFGSAWPTGLNLGAASTGATVATTASGTTLRLTGTPANGEVWSITVDGTQKSCTVGLNNVNTLAEVADFLAAEINGISGYNTSVKLTAVGQYTIAISKLMGGSLAVSTSISGGSGTAKRICPRDKAGSCCAGTGGIRIHRAGSRARLCCAWYPP